MFCMLFIWYLIEEQYVGCINVDLCQLIVVVVCVCISIFIVVSKGVLGGVFGEVGIGNVQGEVQKKLDVISNEILFEVNVWGGYFVVCVFEEMDYCQLVLDIYLCGDFLLLFDFFDGSFNIDVNVLVGIIFLVLCCLLGIEQFNDVSFLQLGIVQVVVGYCIYGLSMQMVFIVGYGMYVFILDCEKGEFVLIMLDMQILVDIQEFVINMFNQCYWEILMQGYVQDLLVGKEGVCGKNFNMCWIVSMVVDVYCIFICGGIFIYLWDCKDFIKVGKLCLMYEVNLMGLLVEQVGGVVIIGCECIFDIQFDQLYQCVLVFFGLCNEVVEVICYYCEYDVVYG